MELGLCEGGEEEGCGLLGVSVSALPLPGLLILVKVVLLLVNSH